MLTLDGELEIGIDNHTAHLWVHGQRMRFECADLRAFLRAARPPTARSRGQEASSALATVREVAARLAGLGVTLYVTSRGRLLVTLGRGARPGLAERVLRIPYLQLGKGVDLLRVLTD